MKLNLQYFAEQIQQDPPEGTQQDPSEGNQPTVEVKKFTQEEVNRIIGERLAKEKAKTEAEFARREQELKQKEFEFKAKEILSGRNLPVELLKALNCKDEETLLDSIKVIEKHFRYKGNEERVTVGTGFTKGCGNETFHTRSIRDAMGL